MSLTALLLIVATALVLSPGGAHGTPPKHALLAAEAVQNPHKGSLSTAERPQKGLPAGDVNVYNNIWTSSPKPPLPTSGPPGICGPWSAATSPQVQAILSAHGMLNSCVLVDHYWLVTTERGAGPAEIGVLNCSPTDSVCMNGWNTKNLTSFTWYPAPSAVAQLRIVLVQGHLVTMVTNYGQWTFDIDTATFAQMVP